VLRGLFVELLAEAKKQTEALQSAKPSVYIEQYRPEFNAKHVVPGQRAQREAMNNGESRARDAEGW